jgi:HTH-type transcriptional regulator / antitoxin HigA
MLKLIKNKTEYEDALERIYNLMQLDLVKGSPEGDELEVLSMFVHAYEEEHYPIMPPHPLDAIKFQLEQMGLEESELNKILGFRSRKSEILSGKRKLSLAMIRKLHEILKIPTDTLIAAY